MRSRCLVLVLLAACDGEIVGGGGPPDGAPPAPDAQSLPDAEPPPPDASIEPSTLAETGLYADFASETLAPGVVEYTVNHELWADGATKRRFVLLPEGAQVDTTDMDFWSLPAGTKLWKEFTSGETRVETRLLWKQGETNDDWFTMSYAWNEAGSEALAAEEGAEDALGTQHDIPRANACKTCHQRQPGFALGFSALQLDHDEGEVNLAALVEQKRLSDPPEVTGVPVFPLPGEAVDQAALGYLHGNCGPCHNEFSDVLDRSSVIWHLDSDSLASVDETTIFQTAVGQPPDIVLEPTTSIIEPGDRDASAAFVRMTQRDPKEDSVVPMPPLATEQPDTEGGVAAVGAWIDSLDQ